MSDFLSGWFVAGALAAWAAASDKGQALALRGAVLAAAALVWAALRFGAVPSLDGVAGILAALGFGRGVLVGLIVMGLSWVAGLAMKRFAPGAGQVVAGAVGRESNKPS